MQKDIDEVKADRMGDAPESVLQPIRAERQRPVVDYPGTQALARPPGWSTGLSSRCKLSSQT